MVFASVLAGLVLAQQAYAPVSAPSPLDNPFKGIVLPPGSDSPIPHRLELQEFLLSDLLVAPDEYDWTALDAALDDTASRDRHAVVWVRTEKAGRQDAIPLFLHDQTSFNLNDVTVTRGGSALPIASPRYQDPGLLIELLKFVTVFGQRYDGDERIAYVIDGLLGRGGDATQQAPLSSRAAREAQSAVAEAYGQAFDLTPVVSRDWAAVRPHGHGLLDDRFGWQTLDAGGLDELRLTFQGQLRQGNLLGLLRRRPVGGVVPWQLGGRVWDAQNVAESGVVFAPQPDALSSQGGLDAIRAVNASFVVDPGLTGRVSSTRQARVEDAIRTMGYTFRVPRFTVEKTPAGLNVTVTIRNDGVAPLFWPTTPIVALMDDAGQVSPIYFLYMEDAASAQDWFFMPGGESFTMEVSPPITDEMLETNGHLLMVGLVGPGMEEPGIKFANEAQDLNAPGWLSLIDLRDVP